MSLDQITEAQRLAREWLEKHGGAGGTEQAMRTLLACTVAAMLAEIMPAWAGYGDGLAAAASA